MTLQANYVKTALRLPPELHAQLLESAARNGRSLNAEMIDILARSQSESALLDLIKQTNDIRTMTRQILDAVTTDK